jgi:hypothetical protein
MSKIWCYTTDKKKRWDYCYPKGKAPKQKKVDRRERCSGKKCAGYRGYQNRTIRGKVCQAWNKQSPHKHYNTPQRKPNSGLERNYCRNPDGMSKIWCYTTDKKKRWDYC